MNERIKILVETLNKAADAYYNQDTEIMSNFEYDALYDELVALEKETGIILENSPTQRAGIVAVSKLKKVKHEYPALSLDKTKDRDVILKWLGDKDGCLSWKMDGLTIVATYDSGKLEKAVTRGDGYVGEDITHNAVHFKGLPRKISYNKKLIVRGEAVLSYAEFNRIQTLLSDASAKYKNPRNLASATVRLLDASESSQREVHFVAFNITYSQDTLGNSFSKKLDWLNDQGFEVVEHVKVTKDNLVSIINQKEQEISGLAQPTDGLVLVYDDVAYGKSLGSTGHHERSGLAFKWKDEEQETVIEKVEWSASRTGLLNPVAVFAPVELEGTTVSRASIHNVSIAKSLAIAPGSKVLVYKANMIIPQISRVTSSTGHTVIPKTCPVCGANTQIKNNDGIETLYCTNASCPAKNIYKFSHFVSRGAMNIDGLSEATLEKLIDAGYVKSFSDIFHLSFHQTSISLMEGFGKKSCENLLNAIENSRKCTFSAFLNALGIPGIGKDVAKLISKSVGNKGYEEFVRKINEEGFTDIEGIGEVLNENIKSWYNANKAEIEELLPELNIETDSLITEENENIKGKTFVITGSLNKFANRDELKEKLQSLGGKVSGSVSNKTSFLVNNDSTSNSSKNKKAKELGVRIITEEELIEMIS